MTTQNFTFSDTSATVPPWIIKSGDVEGSYQLGGGQIPPTLQQTFSDDSEFEAAIERAAIATGFNLGKVSVITDPENVPEREPDITPVEKLEELNEQQTTAEPGRAQNPPPPADQGT